MSCVDPVCVGYVVCAWAGLDLSCYNEHRGEVTLETDSLVCALSEASDSDSLGGFAVKQSRTNVMQRSWARESRPAASFKSLRSKIFCTDRGRHKHPPPRDLKHLDLSARHDNFPRISEFMTLYPTVDCREGTIDAFLDHISQVEMRTCYCETDYQPNTGRS